MYHLPYRSRLLYPIYHAFSKGTRYIKPKDCKNTALYASGATYLQIDRRLQVGNNRYISIEVVKETLRIRFTEGEEKWQKKSIE